MNRSTMMAALGAGALILVAYFVLREPEEEVLTYESVEACIAAGVQDESTCRTEFDKAQALHEKVAPRYATSSTCYGDFGNNRCYQQQTSTGSFWFPFIIHSRSTAPAAAGSSTPAAAPGSATCPATAVPRSPNPRSASPARAPARSRGVVSAPGRRVQEAN